MCSEICPVSCGDDKIWEQDQQPSCSLQSLGLEKNIFDKQANYFKLSTMLSLVRSFVETEQNAKQTEKILCVAADIRGKAEVTIEWGGKKEPTIKGSASGGYTNEKGTKVDIKVEVDKDGSTKTTLSTKVDKKSKPDPKPKPKPSK